MSAVTAIYLVPSMTPRRPDPHAVVASTRARVENLLPDAEATASPSRLPIQVTREADGAYLVSDEAQEVVGVGSTLAEAEADFHATLRQHITYLRTNRARLHPRLLASLHRLQHQFPWV